MHDTAFQDYIVRRPIKREPVRQFINLLNSIVTYLGLNGLSKIYHVQDLIRRFKILTTTQKLQLFHRLATIRPIMKSNCFEKHHSSTQLTHLRYVIFYVGLR
jgi:hypothetical protein